MSDDKVCPNCEGKCCLDYDTGYHVAHMGAECYKHDCEDCNDGNVPQPDPRDATIANLREDIAAWPFIEHDGLCDANPPTATGCACGADEANRARAHARRLAGLEGEP